jgi:hypothetical protein
MSACSKAHHGVELREMNKRQSFLGTGSLCGLVLSVLILAAAASALAGDGDQHLPAGDFNGDRKTDLGVTINSPAISLSLMTGNGNGTFNAPITFSNRSGFDSPAIGSKDLNNESNDAFYSITGRLNYYIRGDHFKLMMDYTHTWSDFREANPEFSQVQFNEVTGRLQVMF